MTQGPQDYRDRINKNICRDQRGDHSYSSWHKLDEFMLPPTSPATQLICPHGLRIKLSMRKAFTSQVKGCATGFDATGLTDAEATAKDAEQVKLCEANANATIEGRDGWIQFTGANNDLATLNYDASAFFGTSNMHVIFSFAINGRIQSYVFHNDYVKPQL